MRLLCEETSKKRPGPETFEKRSRPWRQGGLAGDHRAPSGDLEVFPPLPSVRAEERDSTPHPKRHRRRRRAATGVRSLPPGRVNVLRQLGVRESELRRRRGRWTAHDPRSECARRTWGSSGGRVRGAAPRDLRCEPVHRAVRLGRQKHTTQPVDKLKLKCTSTSPPKVDSARPACEEWIARDR